MTVIDKKNDVAVTRAFGPGHISPQSEKHMHDKYRYLCLSISVALPAIACDLPEKIVGETADPVEQPPEDEEPPQEEPPQDEPPQDEPPQDEPPQEEPPNVDPPTSDPTIVGAIAGTFAVDDTWLFIGTGNMPYRVVKSGGEPVPVVSEESVEGTGHLELIALDDTHVYWVASGGPSWGFKLLRAPKAGGEPTLVTDEQGPNLSVPSAFAVDDEYVYVTLPDLYAHGPDQQDAGVVRRVPKAGGPALEIAQVYASSIAVSDTSVYWPRPTKDGGGELVRADKDGANAEVIFVDLGPIFDVQVAGDRVFWHSYDAGQSRAHTALEGQAPTTLFAESSADFYTGTPAVTAEALYWLRPGGADVGGVRSVDLQGTVADLVTAAASTPYSGFGGPYGARIAADETAIYWAYEGAEGGTPRIYRVAR